MNLAATGRAGNLMSNRIIIYGDTSFPPYGLEEELRYLLGTTGRVLEHYDEGPICRDDGPMWFIELTLNDATSIEHWINRLVPFLKDRRLSRGTTLSVSTYPKGEPGPKHEMIKLYAE
jgi:hypothetical protein